jgi:hypothetical protein
MSTRRNRINRGAHRIQEEQQEQQPVQQSQSVNYPQLLELLTLKSKEFKWVVSFSADRKQLDKQLRLFQVEIKREKLEGYILETPEQLFSTDEDDPDYAKHMYKFSVFNSNVNDANSIMSRALQENHYVILSQVERLESHLQAPVAYQKLIKIMGRCGDALSKSKLNSEWEKIKMKDGHPEIVHLNECVREITTVANKFADIHAANTESYCLKSDEDMMIKLSLAVTENLQEHATNFLIGNAEKSFNGLADAIETHLERKSEKPKETIVVNKRPLEEEVINDEKVEQAMALLTRAGKLGQFGRSGGNANGRGHNNDYQGGVPRGDRVCGFYARGNCIKGDHCDYRHEERGSTDTGNNRNNRNENDYCYICGMPDHKAFNYPDRVYEAARTPFPKQKEQNETKRQKK